MLLITDIGNDPDDVIALSYLIENKKTPHGIIIFPGHQHQIKILSSILKSYQFLCDIYTINDNPDYDYQAGKHELFISDSVLYCKSLISEFTHDEILIIGPPKDLGKKLKAKKMTFQGGFSPNSKPPLQKFKNVVAMHSHNPCNARQDFNLLIETKDIEEKYFVGKNVCHGYTKAELAKTWIPKNTLIKKFWDSLEENKAMHDVLAAQCFLQPEKFKWENAKPIWFGEKLSTVPTDEKIWTLI